MTSTLPPIASAAAAWIWRLATAVDSLIFCNLSFSTLLLSCETHSDNDSLQILGITFWIEDGFVVPFHSNIAFSLVDSSVKHVIFDVSLVWSSVGWWWWGDDGGRLVRSRSSVGRAVRRWSRALVGWLRGWNALIFIYYFRLHFQTETHFSKY